MSAELATTNGATRGVVLRTFSDYMSMAQVVAKSGLAPKGLQTPEAAFLALQTGAELGLSPMQSLQSVIVINGHVGVSGDAMLAIIRASGEMTLYEQSYEGEGDTRTAVVRVQRRGEARASEQRFSASDAKRARLWGKPGPWTEYPDRMLMYRARGFILRDMFGDLLRGFKSDEELRDYPTTAPTPVVYSATPAPAPAPAAVEATVDEPPVSEPGLEGWTAKMMAAQSYGELVAMGKNLPDAYRKPLRPVFAARRNELNAAAAAQEAQCDA